MLPCRVYIYFALGINKVQNSVIGHYRMERAPKLYQWRVRMKKRHKKERSKAPFQITRPLAMAYWR